MQRLINRPVGRESDMRRQSHQRDLVRTLDQATSGSHRSRARDMDLRCNLDNAFSKDEAHCLFDPQLARC